MRGRKPLPTKIKEIQGTLRPSRVNRDEPKPIAAGDLSKAPAWLGCYGRGEWGRVVASLPGGVITGVDMGVFEAYCQAYDEWREAVARIAKEMTATDISIARNARRDLMRLAVELGITPSSRSRVQVSDRGGKKDKAAAVIGF